MYASSMKRKVYETSGHGQIYVTCNLSPIISRLRLSPVQTQ